MRVDERKKVCKKSEGGGIRKFGLWFDERKIAIGFCVLFLFSIIPMLSRRFSISMHISLFHT